MRDTLHKITFLIIILFIGLNIQCQTSIMKNGLVQNLKGEWINTALFDSTLQKRQLHPWFNQFYGDLRLSINDSDSIDNYGNMDGGKGIPKIIDSISFSIPDRVDNPVFIYSSKTDMITSKCFDNTIMVFRRIKKTDNLDIVANEKLFSNFFINQLFTNDYFNETIRPDFQEIWNGFRTYNPFDFDAIGILNRKGQVDYYAWIFKGNYLELYKTSYKYHDESGFKIFKIEGLYKKYKRE